ncbi:MAG TPA: hypothetical protein VGK14_04515 [Novimethylophilus sp.]|jgi:hypothetical protein|uniref:hypothetical protein n=1 Tax=Novimethylophilus sp. TaxID=2137426 RepID=UPI002F3E8749
MKKAFVILAVMLVLALALAQFQHLIWSTATIANDSGKDLEPVEIVVDDAVVNVGRIGAGQSRFVILPDRGDATLSIRFRVADRQYKGCGEYVEGSMYHVRVKIDQPLNVHCTPRLGFLIASKPVLFEMLW